ncbi:MAG: hypothetical protein WA009_13305 [Phototrophicaceae bacterium]|jgi:hypothetical protein|nr:MAG: hypothetical protein UZ13_02973 [Chloroflexi bacterium OLB13]MEB2367248.1 hypothetical protein [Chloroflexota bacterium]
MRRLIVILSLLFLTGGALAQPPDPLLTFGRGEIVSAAWAPDGT